MEHFVKLRLFIDSRVNLKLEATSVLLNLFLVLIQLSWTGLARLLNCGKLARFVLNVVSRVCEVVLWQVGFELCVL